MRRLLAVGFLVSSLFIVSVLTAAAAPENGNGAAPYTAQGCNTYPSGITYCYTDSGVYIETTTPFGSREITDNSRLCYTDTDTSGNVVDQGCINDEHHDQFNASTGDNYFDNYRYDFNTSDGAACVLTQRFHDVDGQLVIDATTFTCS